MGDVARKTSLSINAGVGYSTFSSKLTAFDGMRGLKPAKTGHMAVTRVIRFPSPGHSPGH